MLPKSDRMCELYVFAGCRLHQIFQIPSALHDVNHFVRPPKTGRPTPHSVETEFGCISVCGPVEVARNPLVTTPETAP